MSVKNTPANKKIRKLERALRKGRIPRYLNLVHWLEDHGYAQTAGEARKLIDEDRVMSESHPVGKTVVEIPAAEPTMENPSGTEAMKFRITHPVIPAFHRETLRVIEPKEAVA